MPPRFLTIAIAACLSQALVFVCPGQEEPTKQPSIKPSAEGQRVAGELAEAAKKRIKKTGPSDYELGPIKISSATREVRVPTVLNMTEGILEYALVHESGKTHESLLRTPVSPSELNVALLLCHFEPHVKEAAQYLPEPSETTKARMALPMEKEGANQMKLTVEWTDKAGKAQSAPMAAWVRDKKSGKPASPDHWTYTGSFISQTGFAAEHDGSHIAIYFDLVSLVNLPDRNNVNDENWYVETSAVPPIDTPVTLVFSPIAGTAPASPAK